MPEIIHSLGEKHLLVFLGQLVLLLGLARGLGYLCTRMGQPALLGEVLTGVILGPTLLGRLAPALRETLFPADAIQFAMLDTVAWIGILLLLLSAGLEVDVSVAWKQRSDALKISLSDIILPMVVAFVPALLLPDRYLPHSQQRLLFALFLATVMTISALPITVKALHDLNLLKSDLGLLTLSALTINDLVGWAVFTLILGWASQTRADVAHIGMVIGATGIFAVLCMAVGRRLVAAGIARIQASRASDPGMVLTFVCCVGLAAGIVTQAMGIHALFGLFLAGIMAGGAPALSERTRTVIHQMVHSIFVPVFFAGMALQIDFLAHFDVLLAALFTVIGVGGRYLGAWVGARMTGLSAYDRVTVAVAHTPGGAMEMVMALVALQLGLISLPVYVAIVFSALASSVVLGPWLSWSIRRRKGINLLDLIVRPAVRIDLTGGTPREVIRELSQILGNQPGLPTADEIFRAVWDREQLTGTGVGRGAAVPHARLEGLKRAVVAFGRSVGGVDWDSFDGAPVHLVFLILTPREEDGLQVQILGALAEVLERQDVRRRLTTATDEETVWTTFRDVFALKHLAAAGSVSR